MLDPGAICILEYPSSAISRLPCFDVEIISPTAKLTRFLLTLETVVTPDFRRSVRAITFPSRLMERTLLIFDPDLSTILCVVSPRYLEILLNVTARPVVREADDPPPPHPEEGEDVVVVDATEALATTVLISAVKSVK